GPPSRVGPGYQARRGPVASARRSARRDGRRRYGTIV
ncbi:MAG: hypothetical protein AVDCRST_MAG88-836, partial [uncultured Thermomicrobiales bacterium]